MKELGLILIIGAIFITVGAVAAESHSVSHVEMARCSIGQDLNKRDTSGIAQYRVIYKDGEAVEFKCIKSTPK